MGLPKIERDADADKGPYAVILAPTRELAQQVSWSIRPQASWHKGVMSTRPNRFAQTDEARVQEFTLPLRCALRGSGYFFRKKAEFLWSTYIHGISTYVHTCFLGSFPKGLFRNNHYLQSLHLIIIITLLLITVLNLLLITIPKLANQHLQIYLKAGSLRQ